MTTIASETTPTTTAAAAAALQVSLHLKAHIRDPSFDKQWFKQWRCELLHYLDHLRLKIVELHYFDYSSLVEGRPRTSCQLAGLPERWQVLKRGT